MPCIKQEGALGQRQACTANPLGSAVHLLPVALTTQTHMHGAHQGELQAAPDISAHIGILPAPLA